MLVVSVYYKWCLSIGTSNMLLLKLKRKFRFGVVSWHHCMGVIPCSRLSHGYEGVTLRRGEISFCVCKVAFNGFFGVSTKGLPHNFLSRCTFNVCISELVFLRSNCIKRQQVTFKIQLLTLCTLLGSSCKPSIRKARSS